MLAGVWLTVVNPLPGFCVFCSLAAVLSIASRQSFFAAIAFLGIFPFVHVLATLLWWVPASFRRRAWSRCGVGLMAGGRAGARGRLPKAAGSGQEAGGLIGRVTSDASKVKSGIKSILIGITRNGSFFLGVAVIVTLIDPLIGIVFLVGGLATILAGAVGAWRSSMIIRRSRVREGALTEALHQFLRGAGSLETPTPESRPADSKATRVESLTTLAVHVILGISTFAILILTINAGRNGSLS